MLYRVTLAYVNVFQDCDGTFIYTSSLQINLIENLWVKIVLYELIIVICFTIPSFKLSIPHVVYVYLTISIRFLFGATINVLCFMYYFEQHQMMDYVIFVCMILIYQSRICLLYNHFGLIVLQIHKRHEEPDAVKRSNKKMMFLCFVCF